MGFIGGLILTGILLYGAYCYVRYPLWRKDLHKELAESPLYSLWVSFGALCFLTFFWCLLIPSFGYAHIFQIGGWNVRVWHATSIGAILWFLSIGVVEKLRGRV
jgi:hypothetical protein